jgi:hypothetical protein
MRWLFIVAVLLAMRLEAADFRMSDFGESCALLAEREAALGSEPMPLNGAPAYKTKLFGHEVSIIYVCTTGVLRIGNYVFPKQTREAAVETLRVVYDDLVSTYGVPFLDGSPWQYGEATIDPRAIYEPGYLTAWRTPRVNLTAVLVQDKRDPGPNWKVMVVFSSVDVAGTSRSPAGKPRS